jgi:hypothetical protein
MQTSDDWLIRLIAVFKFVKAGLLIALGVGVFRLVHKDLGSVIEHWCEAMRLDPGSHFVNLALEKAAHVSPEQVKKLGLGSFLYAGLFLAKVRVCGCESVGGSGSLSLLRVLWCRLRFTRFTGV